MKHLVMIYRDDTLLASPPAGEFDSLMHGCFMHADDLRAQGQLHDSQPLEAPSSARPLRMRNVQQQVGA